MDKLHKIDMRGRTDTNWTEKHAKWIRYWQQCQSMVLQGQPIIGHAKHSQEYMAWYQSKTFFFKYETTKWIINEFRNWSIVKGNKHHASRMYSCILTNSPMTDYVPPTYTPIPPFYDELHFS